MIVARKTFVETICNAVQACSSKAGKGEKISTEVKERDPRFEGKLKAKKSDSAETQHGVSKSANIVQEKSSMSIESRSSSIRARHVEFFGIKYLCETIKREKTGTAVDRRDCRSRAENRELVSWAVIRSIPITIACERARSPINCQQPTNCRTSRCKSGKNVGDAASKENATGIITILSDVGLVGSD